MRLMPRALSAFAASVIPWNMAGRTIDPQWVNAVKGVLQNVSQDVADSVIRIVTGQPVPPRASVIVSRWSYYDSAPYAAAGTSAFNATFFNGTYTPGVRNTPGPNLPNDHVFIVDSLGIELEHGYNATTFAEVAAGAQFDAALQATALSFIMAEQKRKILDSCVLQLSIGQDVIVDDYGLKRYPSGCGPYASPAIAGTAAATNVGSAAPMSNGVPSPGTRRLIGPSLVTPTRPMKLTVQQLAGLPLTNAGVIRADLQGWMVRTRV